MKSLRKAFDVLDYLAKEKRDVRLTEISSALSINKSSVHKMLAVMCEYEYVRQDGDTNKYGLGGKFVKIGSTMLRSTNIRVVAHPFMEKLGKETKETVNLMIRHGNKGMYIDIIESPLLARTFQMVGTIEYLHACAIGKVLLAHLPASEVAKIARTVGLPARIAFTITNFEELKAQLKKIKKQGFAIEQQEVCLGVFCVAAPIFDHSGAVVASMSISAPTVRMSDELMEKYSRLITETTGEISKALNFTA